MTKYVTKPLDASTWPDFERVVEMHNGIWGGCWCMWYHENGTDGTPATRKKRKQCLVRDGQSHASLIYEGSTCVGWCQFGTPDELPRIHNQKAYLATSSSLPDWRITCFFSSKGHRGNGVASAALAGAIDQIRKLGGGRIEGYPEDTKDRKASPAFLFNGALTTFERLKFKPDRKIGKHKWVVTRTVRRSK